MNSKPLHTVDATFVRGGLAFTETHSYNDEKWGLVTVTNKLKVQGPRRVITSALRRLGFVKAKP